MENTIKATETLIEERMPVWIALSDLFLDSELNDNDINDIIKRCKKIQQDLGYSLSLIEKIYLYEVAPTLNFVSYETPWAGYDKTWLKRTILSNIKHQFITEKTPISWWKKIMGKYYTRYAQEDWGKVKKALRPCY